MKKICPYCGRAGEVGTVCKGCGYVYRVEDLTVTQGMGNASEDGGRPPGAGRPGSGNQPAAPGRPETGYRAAAPGRPETGYQPAAPGGPGTGYQPAKKNLTALASAWRVIKKVFLFGTGSLTLLMWLVFLVSLFLGPTPMIVAFIAFGMEFFFVGSFCILCALEIPKRHIYRRIATAGMLICPVVFFVGPFLP